MTHEQHKARHQILHEAFDELLADYLRWNPETFPSTITALELMAWSHLQTILPTQDEPDHAHAIPVCAHCGNLVIEPAAHVCNGVH